MEVKDIMVSKVITIPDSATYEEAAKILVSNKISGSPVVDGSGQVVGMMTKKDLFKVLYPFYRSFYESPQNYAEVESRENKASEIRNHKISDFMTRSVITVEPQTPIISAGAIMLAHQVHRLPVVADNKLVGIITRKDVFEFVLKQNFSF